MTTDWLSDLEEKVQSAAEELKALRKENTSQKKKIEDLQIKLTEAEASSQSNGVWDEEREAIRKRVEKLATGLEKLL